MMNEIKRWKAMEERMTIMIVEDDEVLAKEVQSFLVKWNYNAVIASHFDAIIDDFMNYKPHLVLMDINLPFFDGFYWCHQIRILSQVPIIYISSRNDDHDQIMGIAQGGDDYIEKPFHLELLKAKIEAILRRTYQYKTESRIYITHDMIYEQTHQTLYYQTTEIELTKSEKRMLAKLIDKRPHVVSRNELMMDLWNTNEYVSDGTLTTMMSRLRSKLKKYCHQDIIFTKKGIGYYIL